MKNVWAPLDINYSGPAVRHMTMSATAGPLQTEAEYGRQCKRASALGISRSLTSVHRGRGVQS